MKRQIIRVEPLSSYLERWKAPASVMTRHGDTLYLSGLPPFDPDTGEVVNATIERQTELALEQMKLCLETAGSSLDRKSTRLNSSHANISYAVFCLKKKKKNN